MFDPRKIVSRLKAGGRATRNEVELLRNIVCEPQQGQDLYNAMRALALSLPPNEGDISHIERVLRQSGDDWLVQGAIYALCSYWDLTSKYVPDLLKFVPLERWEEWPSAAIASIAVLGSYVAQTEDGYVARRLVAELDRDMELFKTGKPEFRPVHATILYDALFHAVRGQPRASYSGDIKLPEGIDWSIIESAMRISKVN